MGDPTKADFTGKDYSGALIQYPNTYGEVISPEAFVEKAHAVRIRQTQYPCMACGQSSICKTGNKTW